MMTLPKVMILAAGRGNRMGHLTKRTPKPLLKVNSVPLIEQTIIRLKKNGFSEFVINLSWLGEQIKSYLGNGDQYGVKIAFSDEGEEPLGTGGGIKNCLNKLGGEPFWLINGDVLSDFRLDPNYALKDRFLGHLILVDNPSHNLEGEFGLREEVITKGPLPLPFTYSGMGFLHPNIFLNIRKRVFPLEPLLYKLAIDGCLSGEHFRGEWLDVGTIERLTIANKPKIRS